MTADVTSYSVLGLKPGADRDAIEQAYRRLIKLYHPDRAGGDGERAAEINRAYFELRGGPAQDAPQRRAADVAEAIYMRHAGRSRSALPKRRRLPWKPLALLAMLVAAALWRSELGAFGNQLASEIREAIVPAENYSGGTASTQRPDALDGALDAAAIRDSIREVRSLMADGEVAQIADLSRECHRRMRRAPSAAQLDRCAALDFTAVAIARTDPLHDDGPFSASAVTAREMSAARLLSDDYLSIETRLDQVRSRVIAAVSPPPPTPPPPPKVGDDDPMLELVKVPAGQAGRTERPGRRPD